MAYSNREFAGPMAASGPTSTAVMRSCNQSLRAAAASASGPLTRRPKRLRSSAASTSSLQGAVATALAWCVSAAAAAVAA
jgi:hypothetical protein